MAERDPERDLELKQRNGGARNPETGGYDGSFSSSKGYAPGEADMSDDEPTFNIKA